MLFELYHLLTCVCADLAYFPPVLIAVATGRSAPVHRRTLDRDHHVGRSRLQLYSRRTCMRNRPLNINIHLRLSVSRMCPLSLIFSRSLLHCPVCPSSIFSRMFHFSRPHSSCETQICTGFVLFVTAFHYRSRFSSSFLTTVFCARVCADKSRGSDSRDGLDAFG